MITIHHLEISRSHRIIWLMEELGLKYEIKHYKRDPRTRLAPPELLAIAPLGKAPIITDGDLTLAESGAIIEYILYKYGKGKLKPKEGTPEWIKYLYWLHFAEGTMMPTTVISTVFRVLLQSSPFLIKPIMKSIKKQVDTLLVGPNLNKQLNLVDSTLSKQRFFSGHEFTGADIQMGINFAFWEGDVLTEFTKGRPHLLAYITDMKKRPAYIKMMEVAGPITGLFKVSS